MGDSRLWLRRARHHVGAAQLVLGEVDRGLATVERAEDAAERAVPFVRALLVVALGCAVGAAVYVLVSRRTRHARPVDEPIEVDPDSPAAAQL